VNDIDLRQYLDMLTDVANKIQDAQGDIERADNGDLADGDSALTTLEEAASDLAAVIQGLGSNLEELRDTEDEDEGY
jgi:hypothetical protein